MKEETAGLGEWEKRLNCENGRRHACVLTTLTREGAGITQRTRIYMYKNNRLLFEQPCISQDFAECQQKTLSKSSSPVSVCAASGTQDLCSSSYIHHSANCLQSPRVHQTGCRSSKTSVTYVGYQTALFLCNCSVLHRQP